MTTTVLAAAHGLRVEDRRPVGGRLGERSLRRRLATALADESGAATAEYAIATLAAVGFAGLLVVILRGDDIKGMLTDIIHRALTLSS